MIDRKIFEDRLTYKETTITGHTAVSRLVARFNAFVNAAVSALGASDAKTPVGLGCGERETALEQYDALVKELTLMRLEIDKAEAVFATLPREREEFEVYSDTIAQQTARVEAEIVALKERLVVERAIRLQREEYEALAKLVNKYPAKAQTTVGQTKVAAEIAALEEEKGRLGKAVAMRKRQLSFVLNAVRDLKNGLEYDMRTDEEKERFLAEQAAAVAKCKEEGGEMEGEGDEDEEDEESEMQMD